MNRISWLGLFSLIFAYALACGAESGSPGCGQFQAVGSVKTRNHKYKIIVNEGSQSEYQIEFPLEFNLKLMVFQERWVKADFTLMNFEKGFHLKASQLTKIEEVAPDPLHQSEIPSFFKVKELECTKN